MKHMSQDHHIYVLDPAGTPVTTIGSGEGAYGLTRISGWWATVEPPDAEAYPLREL